ncbi:MAG: hypothetical protein ACOZCP_13120 [Pseudomonadota bacterium]
MAPHSLFDPVDPWQAMLDRHGEVFSEMLPGSLVGLVPREGSGIQPGKHVAGLVAAGGDGHMLIWEMTEAGMRAGLRPYHGFQDAGVDLLFVASDEALRSLHASLDGQALSSMKRLIRQGGIMFYVMRTKYQLQDAGYEEFLDSLGLAFLGACR